MSALSGALIAAGLALIALDALPWSAAGFAAFVWFMRRPRQAAVSTGQSRQAEGSK